MKQSVSIGLSVVCVGLLVLLMVGGAPACRSRFETTRRNAQPVDWVNQEQADRNAVWTLFNRQCELPTDEAVQARIWPVDLFLCLAMSPSTALEIKIMALEDLRAGGAINFSSDDIARLARVLCDEGVESKSGLMRNLVADSIEGIHIQSVLVDRDRMRLFMWGEPIPLE
ncbi:MAG: hypothetical protein V1738_05195 [Patescibacteria group bacterium]